MSLGTHWFRSEKLVTSTFNQNVSQSATNSRPVETPFRSSTLVEGSIIAPFFPGIPDVNSFSTTTDERAGLMRPTRDTSSSSGVS
ncbi:Uncharacterized protein APZ42_033633 [Daphnia magna]|uniref:Uncharacterized protein n=1 Tax=Daphnia magna TaxID=35525 RepID=A0A164KWY2_9CRUS|nr:Uncharacterized protein APZ42_033633 [Daphnia magna]